MADIDSERELVTIQSFRELSEAMLAKGMLNSAGIECYLVDDNTGHMLGFISNVIGGIRMKVNKGDAEAAMALLEQPIPAGVDLADKGNDQPPRCPKCYSVDIAFRELDKPMSTGAWLSVPLPVHEKVCECKSCGYQWDDEDNALDDC
jgi:predicted Zn-ribbon and HTH transcriptional regulator